MKILKILKKDMKITCRDMLLIYIIIIPLILAVIINICAPGISDSFVKIAMLSTEEKDCIGYMKKYADVEIFDTQKELEKRVLKRDDVTGIVSDGENFDVITEGNEDEKDVDAAKELVSLYKLGAVKENTTAEIYSFEKKVPKVKTMLANILIETIIMLSAMLIALGIVDEKTDNTISAVKVTPVSLNQFLTGKSLPGCIVSIISIICSLLIMGYHTVNWGMLIVISLTTMIITVITGIMQGIASSDIIEAAVAVKLLMVPMIASMLIYELLSDKWQWTMYWNPFYWSYKANSLVLSGTAGWKEVLLCSGLVFVIAMIIYRGAKPVIREGMKQS